uniref:Uncharacterized protein n=1 Tax=Oryza glumipatula TaxID=40148 RepID=A0A0D9ZJD7_9ORYZ
MAKVALLLLFLVQVMSVIGGGAAAARPLQQADGGAVIGMLASLSIGSDGSSHLIS